MLFPLCFFCSSSASRQDHNFSNQLYIFLVGSRMTYIAARVMISSVMSAHSVPKMLYNYSCVTFSLLAFVLLLTSKSRYSRLHTTKQFWIEYIPFLFSNLGALPSSWNVSHKAKVSRFKRQNMHGHVAYAPCWSSKFVKTFRLPVKRPVLEVSLSLFLLADNSCSLLSFWLIIIIY